MDRSGPPDFLELKRFCEEGLRAGAFSAVRKALSRVRTTEIPRELRLDFAQIGRRSDQISFGLRVLRPLMDGSSRLMIPPASASEKAEYGVLLQRIGSLPQALRLLESLAEAESPESLLYRSFCHFPAWDYEKAWPLLHRYVAHPSLSDYQRLIGRVNLAAAAVVLKRLDEADEILAFLREETRRLSHLRLLTNALELSAQLEIQRNRGERAAAWLEEGERLLAGQDSLDTLFISKWRAVLSAERGDFSGLESFQEAARKRSHWESLREADLLLMKYRRDPLLAAKLYAGSPMPAYRKRILDAAPDSFREPADYMIGSEGEVFDLSRGSWGGKVFLSPGRKPHLFLQSLVADFYRPRRMATVFSEVFADQEFDILSSPNRVHQVVKRSREILEEAGLPLRVTETKGNYHFAPPSLFRLRIEIATAVASTEDFRLKRLAEVVGGREFSAREARGLLGLPLTTYHRWMEWALGAGVLLKTGQGPKVRYRIASSALKSAA